LFLIAFLESDTAIVLDEEGHVFDEYVEHGLTRSDHELVSAFIRALPDRNVLRDPSLAEEDVKTSAAQLVAPAYSDDRILIRLASVSSSHVLTSHDEAAFPRSRRGEVETSCGVVIADGQECAELIASP
jgi:hypothetical protein